MPLPDISRHHCRFRLTERGWDLTDLDSTNGVYVNGARVQYSALHAGDHVRICGLEFEIEEPEAIEGADVLRKIAEALPAELPQRKAS